MSNVSYHKISSFGILIKFPPIIQREGIIFNALIDFKLEAGSSTVDQRKKLLYYCDVSGK